MPGTLPRNHSRISPHARPYARTFAQLLVAGIPLVLAVFQSAIVNRWMTGSPVQPPYVYGGFGFQSMDLLHPQMGTVLTHPWRGLLAFHPLYGVAFIALLAIPVYAVARVMRSRRIGVCIEKGSAKRNVAFASGPAPSLPRMMYRPNC